MKKEIKFRIVQLGDDNFLIEKLFKEELVSGNFWFPKTIIKDKWKMVDKYGNQYRHRLSKLNNFIEYKTKEEAEKAIEDLEKYPIYYYLKDDKG